MGKTTEEARQYLLQHPYQRLMQAVVMVKEKGKNILFHQRATYGESKNAHVELILMQGLYGKFEGFSKIPNNSTIIFEAKWSPCTQCTEYQIPDFIEKVGAVEKGIQVKFRFENFYTKALWEQELKKVGGMKREHGGSTLWKDEKTASSAYDKLGEKYGICRSRDVVSDSGEKGVKINLHLVIQSMKFSSTSIVGF